MAAMTRLQIYVAGSAVLANIVLLRAYYERPNFYSAAVYISQSTGSLMFLINLALIITASFGYGLQRLFYGSLRAIETEQLYDKAWFAVSETLLAMTIVRDDVGIWFFAMFLCLLGGKVWQWIGEGRVELLEQQPPANPWLFHARLTSSLLLSVTFDLLMMNYCIDYCIDSILQEVRPGVMVMFGFEYVLLAISSLSTLLRYGLSLIELTITLRQEKAREEARRVAREARQRAAQSEGAGETEFAEAVEDDEDEDDGDVPGWEEKGRWVFYLDLTTDFFKSVIYLGFFMIFMAFYGIPIHIMRDLYLSVRSFIKRCNDFVKYRNATRDMNARYPDATAEELQRENTCIVCREEMRPWVQPGQAQPGQRVDERQRPKKLPCGHILHFSCLRSWLERQQVCPTCRRSVLAEATPPNNAPPGQANQGQQNNQQQPNAPPLNNFNNLLPQNLRQPQPAAAGHQAVPGQAPQQPQQGVQPGAQPNQPAGNFRVFNLGPLRIALGNLRVPQGQQPQQAQANNNAIANLAQQMAQNQGNLPVQQVGMPQQGMAGMPMFHVPHVPNPADIQSDILRIQQNIIDSLQQVNAQAAQLQYIHALLAELNRLQRMSGVTAQDLPPIASLQAPTMMPTAPPVYIGNSSYLTNGDPELPNGLVLPEGWTLRPMARVQSNPFQPRPGPSFTASGPAANGMPPTTALRQPSEPSASSSTVQPAAQAAPTSSTPSSPPPQPQPPASSSSEPKRPEPSSSESSWSFGNVGEEAGSGSGSGVGVAGPSTSTSTSYAAAGDSERRTAMVEDGDDEE